MPLNPETIERFSQQLELAEKNRAPIPAFTAESPELHPEDAYAIQLAVAERRQKSGERLIGYKVGLTSYEAQAMFKVFEPDLGHLFPSMVVTEGGEIPMVRLIQPKIEAEIAMVLGRDLSGPGVTLTQAMQAVDFMLPAMEIVDSRIANWKIKAFDTIADNGSSACLVLGTRKTKPSEVDLEQVGMALSVNGEVSVTGAGTSVIGGPFQSVAFLANELGKLGKTMKVGDLILTGAMGGMIPIRPGDFYSCEMRKLGRVTARAGKVAQ